MSQFTDCMYFLVSIIAWRIIRELDYSKFSLGNWKKMNIILEKNETKWFSDNLEKNKVYRCVIIQLLQKLIDDYLLFGHKNKVKVHDRVKDMKKKHEAQLESLIWGLGQKLDKNDMKNYGEDKSSIEVMVNEASEIINEKSAKNWENCEGGRVRWLLTEAWQSEERDKSFFSGKSKKEDRHIRFYVTESIWITKSNQGYSFNSPNISESPVVESSDSTDVQEKVSNVVFVKCHLKEQ